jgi:sorting and assembly machinery component 35
MKVPEPLRQVFDSVPLHEFPPVRQLAAQEKEAVEQRHHRYSVKTSSTKFTLCVYNVYQADDNTYLATDPLCLAVELALGHTNGITIPKVNNDHLDKSRDSVFIVSHHAHPDGHLPLYVEEDNKRRITKDYVHIQDSLMNSVKSSSEIMLISLVDSVIYDSWITTLLFECDTTLKSQIYIHEPTENYELVNSLGVHSLVNCLIHRNGFELRNPHITKLYEHDTTSFLASFFPKNQRGVAFEKERNQRELEHALDNLENILAKKQSQFFSDSLGLLDIKLASYVTLCEKFMKDTSMYQVLSQHELLLAHARQVLKQCS